MRFIKYVTKYKSNRGDTLVEVLFATATAALIIVTTLVLMNRNLAQIQVSVETTFVRQAIDSQAEVLRYIRDQYKADPDAELDGAGKPTLSKLWKDIVDSGRTGNFAQSSASKFGTCQPDDDGDLSSPAGGKAFYINKNNTDEAEGDTININEIGLTKLTASKTSLASTYAKPGQGIWVESVNPSFSETEPFRYVDFHIRACWNPPYDGPKATLGTIVRLYYEPPQSEITAAKLQCQDGVNNDPEEDDLIDSNDPGCHFDGNAGNPSSYVATRNTELDTPPLPECNDTFDNDGDGRTDFEEEEGFGCTNIDDNDETDPPPTFAWSALGSAYTSCAPPNGGDGFNGCFKRADSSMYAYRNFTTTYGLSGVRAGEDATIEIEYGQWIPGSLSGYNYNVRIGTSGSPSTTFSLPANSTGTRQTFTSTIDINTDNPSTLTLSWLNNTVYNGSQDPNLQIYKITLRRT